MINTRRLYTLEEDNLILEWIVKTKLFYTLRGKNFWMDLSRSNLFEGRSWQSLQNRFEKKVFPDITNPKYTISDLDKAKIILAWQQTADNYDSNESNMDETTDTEQNNEDTDTDAEKDINCETSSDSENDHVTSSVRSS
ncbi:uncharacterized protein LOC130896207 [Diorhabda carinulata]|uniref:uncharacterized protein LOC130896207 n=1 Tax=Diorhabda carinulata TaxID=1163345 RepID=UPI0025A1CEE5|nr:uncharacterized protein LOC130896207 [Diorhabda carinulata]XP_057660121.1 uncharacterized protein LOC130896207 [Diorhabda carinulata]